MKKEQANEFRQTGLSFLNSNLEEYFKNKDYSVIGTKTHMDAMGEKYKAYSFEIYDIPRLESPYNGLNASLVQIKTEVDNLLSGLMQAKRSEKPEGAPTAQRSVEVHWRCLPGVDINEGDFDTQPRMQVYFRISLHHSS